MDWTHGEDRRMADHRGEGSYDARPLIVPEPSWMQIARLTEHSPLEPEYRWRCEECSRSWEASLALVARDAQTHTVVSGHATIVEVKR